jgi:hypothetical protein
LILVPIRDDLREKKKWRVELISAGASADWRESARRPRLKGTNAEKSSTTEFEKYRNKYKTTPDKSTHKKGLPEITKKHNQASCQKILFLANSRVKLTTALCRKGDQKLKNNIEKFF